MRHSTSIFEANVGLERNFFQNPAHMPVALADFPDWNLWHEPVGSTLG
jgi:hypothetical protein